MPLYKSNSSTPFFPRNGVEESGRKNAPQGALPLRIMPLLKLVG
jgi:hypothetical protein